MIINLAEQLMGFDRYNGGWVKTITGLDKDYQNGYSLNGEFVANKRVKNVNMEPNTLYLDCSIGGSRKNQKKNYHLFKLVDDEIEIIQTIEDGQADWALQLWDNVEKELQLQKTKAQMIMEDIKKLNDEEFDELMVELVKTPKFITWMVEEGIPSEPLAEMIKDM